MSSQKITDLKCEDAKWFFRDEKNYVNFDLPPYFNFKNLLVAASASISSHNSFDQCCKKLSNQRPDYPCNHEQVNHTVLSNKDGSFGWRPLQLIHPVLYVDLVNLITKEENWALILDRFNDFKNTCVECISIPRVSTDDSSHKASQVVHWWEEMEQRSIKMALKYNYLFSTDIANCYSSIYTHSIEWALTKGGKDVVKQNRLAGVNNKGFLGAKIDQKIQNMNHGQTNGIPQGSTLMDFIAEIVLGYGDIMLTEILEKEIPKEEEFYILRYRDDYKIFVNNPVVGRQILKHLNVVLYGLNMKMNPDKTAENDDVITSSIKIEKLERISVAPTKQQYQKEALRIYQISKKYPNAGLVTKELSLFYDRIISLKYLKDTDIEVLVSIFSMLAVSSPRLINWIAAIISKLLELMNDDSKRIDVIRMIYNKFERVPNTSFIDVWLQRISAPLGLDLPYKDKLTSLALKKICCSNLWESSWLDDTIMQLLDCVSISDLPIKIENNELPAVIPRTEVELFRLNYN